MTIKRTPNFKKDLEIGAAGEAKFQKHFPVALTKMDGRKSDFIVMNKPGSGLELKTDTYDSPNFFFERWSDLLGMKPGGPWQAQAHSYYFVYYFIRKNVYYVFRVEDLVKELDKYTTEKKSRLIEVRNSRYTTAGFVVPINDMKNIAICYNDLLTSALPNDKPNGGYIPCGCNKCKV